MNKSIGILGGGQLGKMLYSAGNQHDITLKFMDSMTEGPVASVTEDYEIGNITDESDVKNFGKDLDVVSIEIERVNIDGLKALEKSGVAVYPQPDIIKSIQDKGLQKQFYLDNNLPSAPFKIYENISSFVHDVDENKVKFPLILKMRKDGYDGRGVQKLNSEKDLDKVFPYNFLAEECIEIEKELAVITCSDPKGNIVVYDPVEMVFHPAENILLYQLAPADIEPTILQEVQDLAIRTTKAFGIVGLLAIEFFLTPSGEVIINEVAPRPHNSGHHTIEASITSQYDNHLRAISGMSLGDPATTSGSLLMNLLGEDDITGPVYYEGLQKVKALENVHVHLYGKTTTKPFRKMGHINILGDNRAKLIEKYQYIKDTLRVISK